MVDPLFRKSLSARKGERRGGQCSFNFVGDVLHSLEERKRKGKPTALF